MVNAVNASVVCCCSPEVVDGSIEKLLEDGPPWVSMGLHGSPWVSMGLPESASVEVQGGLAR